MNDLITEARELCASATPGPWKVDKQGRYIDHDECYVELSDDSMTINNFIVEGCRYENAEFIARSRTLIPELCDALEKARPEIIRLTAALRDARNELCLKCGRYHEAHNGACDGCRWREEEHHA